ncbi:SDR family oxidoreductase [Alkalicoccus urumqiensis]|uniref:D-mannonate oxidoreductase n=1 Tax=Alkalicoccus urumqiensis TaxID=1548213 RepID=A0A2P6MJQ1_ALKUR|nr:SDR family oxidoreductase [Alkalicoccus urumqiensis]PRO66497.1 D-mannonate oxidoreductase [Alkalicoccus urumqiensis]
MTLPLQVDLTGRVVAITGGSGVLGSVMSEALAEAGAKIAVLAIDQEANDRVVRAIEEKGGTAKGYIADVLSKEGLEETRAAIHQDLGPVDILINGAGGNSPKATTTNEQLSLEDMKDSEQRTFFDLDSGAVEKLFQLNFIGTLLPTQVFAQDMVGKDHAAIINISSMNAYRPLTKIPAYSGAKAAISNFTQWLSTYFAEVGIRVNAIAPGFFLTAQNRELLLDENGDYTERAQKIIEHTPQHRFGEPDELLGTLLWLLEPKASGFVNGIVVPIDGGFSAYSGV